MRARSKVPKGELEGMNGSCELRYGADSLSLEDIRYYPEDAANGNPYNTTCRVKVTSGGFAGVGEWELDWAEFLCFVAAVEELYGFQRPEAELLDICYGSQVKLAMNKTGKMAISGKLYGEAMDQTLEFQFSADQTALEPFLRQLRQICR